MDFDEMPGVGQGGLLELQNAPIHVAGFMLLGVAAVIGLKALGFRFVVGANVSGGMG